MKRITRQRHLTAEEVARDEEVRRRVEQDFPPAKLCDHYGCRCLRANELAEMGMPETAVELHQKSELVVCRR